MTGLGESQDTPGGGGACPGQEEPTPEAKAVESDRRKQVLHRHTRERPGQPQGQPHARPRGEGPAASVCPVARAGLPSLSFSWGLAVPRRKSGSQRRELPKFAEPEMAELEFEPLSGWSLNVPTSQNIRTHSSTDLEQWWGGRKRGIEGPEEAERARRARGIPASHNVCCVHTPSYYFSFNPHPRISFH